MMRTNYYFFCFIINIFFISTTSFAQTANFDETWKEFLRNNKISNMSELAKPDKTQDQPNYARYLLMNTNSSFCQSELEDAERLMAEVQNIDPQIHKSIPGYVEKMVDLETKIKAYHSIDAIWNQFLETNEVMHDKLEAIDAAKTICEKRTLAKYSYMTAYYYFCQGDISKSKNIFENRTLRLTEKTSLRVRDIEGLESEVAKMKSLYMDMSKLDAAWKSYVETGVSPGFDMELPLFKCNPIPNIKEYVLRGVVDVCDLGPEMLSKIRKLQSESGVVLNREVKGKVKELENAIKKNEDNLSALNEAWLAFIPENKARHTGKYGYEYCSKEPLIRAYIMDGFAYICEIGEEMLDKIDSLQRYETTTLEDITMKKINELAELTEQYQANGVEIEDLWTEFVSQGDTLYYDFHSIDFYCDNIHQVKDWTMNGLCGSCEEGYPYLDKIEEFQETFEFKFVKDLECRVQKLRIKVWECRYKTIVELARLESETDSYEERLAELMREYGMGERPEVCTLDE